MTSIALSQAAPDAGATLTGQLAEFVVNARLRHIPPHVAARAKMFIMDYLGVALTAASSRSSEIISGVVEQLGGSPSCSVIGRQYKTNPLMAALVNGTTGHAIEMDDDHRTSVLHPGVAVVPAALAAAELAGAGGDRLIEGVVSGYELMTRIGDAFLGTQYYEGFHPTGTCGVFGAAAAAGSILGLSREQLIAALGIAGTQACGLEEWKTDGSWIKRLHPGKAAENGLLAVLLAKAGYTGPATILEGEHGFLKAFSFERKWDVDMIIGGLGKEYRGYGTSFKPYAGCRFFHQVIDATLALVDQHKFDSASVEEVIVRVYRTAYLTLFTPESRRYRPGTVVDAQFSIPYAVAVSVLHGRPLPKHFTDHMIRQPDILALAGKVKGIPDDEYESRYPKRFPTEVTVRLKGGKTIRAFRDLPSGDPENPIYAEPGRFEREILDKFRLLLADQGHYAARAEEMVRRSSALESERSVSAYLEMFTPAETRS